MQAKTTETEDDAVVLKDGTGYGEPGRQGNDMREAAGKMAWMGRWVSE